MRTVRLTSATFTHLICYILRLHANAKLCVMRIEECKAIVNKPLHTIDAKKMPTATPAETVYSVCACFCKYLYLSQKYWDKNDWKY